MVLFAACVAAHPQQGENAHAGEYPTSPASSVAAAPGASNAPEDPAKRALQALLPEFYAAVGEFEDLKAAPGLSPEAVAALEKKLEFCFSKELRELLTRCAAVSMAGLSVKAAEFGPLSCPARTP